MTNQEIQRLLSEVQKAVGDDQIRKASDLLLNLNTELNAIQTAEKVLIARSTLVHGQGSTSTSERQALSEYISAATSIQLQRAQMLAQASQYVSDPDRSGDSLLKTIRDTASKETDLKNKHHVAESVQTTEHLPPSLEILDVSSSSNRIPKGSTVELSVTVGNAGDKRAIDTEVDMSCDTGLNVKPETRQLNSVTSNKTTTAELTGLQTGQHSIEINITSKNAGDGFETSSVQVVGKDELISEAQLYLEELLNRIESNHIERSDYTSLKSKVENATQKVADTQKFVESGNAKQVDNMLRAASRILGALLNQLSANSPEKSQKPEETETFYLEQMTEATIDTISEARAASN